MGMLKTGTWDLPPRTLGIALLPLAVILFSLSMAGWFGMPDAPPALHPVQDSFIEAAARLRMLATWTVLAVLGAGSIGYFLVDLRRFEAKSVAWLLGVLLLAAASTFAWASSDPTFGRAEHSIGEATICMAFEGKAQPHAVGPSKAAAPGAGTLTNPEAPGGLARLNAPECAGIAKFRWMQELNSVQLYLLLLVLPAMVLGAISTLAGGARPAEQAARLKTYLYLAAILLVCGLLYLSALLRWPGASLRGDEALHYDAFVDAYLLDLGAAYSLFIVSYYLPVVARLAKTAGRVTALTARGAKASGNAKAQAGDDALGPLDILKIVLALFAPVITALLGNVVKL
ncbi:MAG TPA: hypothetical protein VFW19_15995 [Allosphingosinicella sp.]|nr:hypothetical protein [Allosphingosinicella sp.]